MDNHLSSIAKRIPKGIRQAILQEMLIEKAVNVDIRNTPMEYLFDVYTEYIDSSKEVDNWNCPKCRQKVIDDFRILKDYLKE